MNTSDNSLNVAAEIAGLRGEMGAGFARLEGQLNVIAQASGRTSQDVQKLDERVTALESRRFPYGAVSAVCVVLGTILAAATLMVQH